MKPGNMQLSGSHCRRVALRVSAGQSAKQPQDRRVKRKISSPQTARASTILAPSKGQRHQLPDKEEDCPVFIDKDGNVKEAMCCDYGFRSGFGRLYQGGDGEIPKNLFELGWDNYKKEFRQLRRSFRVDEYNTISDLNPPTGFFWKFAGSAAKQLVRGVAALDLQLEHAGILNQLEDKELPDDVTTVEGEEVSEAVDMRTRLAKLELSNEAVWEKEDRRIAQPDWGANTAPWPIRAAYLALCVVLDRIYDRRPIQRFWFLEVVARMPYFSYISMLHLYESLGWWRAGAELRRVHFAEEWNELHHLMIMESLGGDQLWIDRFMAQHAAVFYYWVLIAFFAVSPSKAYLFSEMVEGHAADTYEQFAEQNKELLESMPPPLVALEYYKGGDLYMFDALRSGRRQEPRRPACDNLFDVFNNICADEKEHVKTMTACRDYSIVDDLQLDKQQTAAPTKSVNQPANMDTTRID